MDVAVNIPGHLQEGIHDVIHLILLIVLPDHLTPEVSLFPGSLSGAVIMDKLIHCVRNSYDRLQQPLLHHPSDQKKQRRRQRDNESGRQQQDKGNTPHQTRSIVFRAQKHDDFAVSVSDRIIPGKLRTEFIGVQTHFRVFLTGSCLPHPFQHFGPSVHGNDRAILQFCYGFFLLGILFIARSGHIVNDRVARLVNIIQIDVIHSKGFADRLHCLLNMR